MLVAYGLPNCNKFCFHFLYFCKKVGFCWLLWMVCVPPVGVSLVEATSGTGFVLVAAHEVNQVFSGVPFHC